MTDQDHIAYAFMSDQESPHTIPDPEPPTPPQKPSEPAREIRLYLPMPDRHLFKFPKLELTPYVLENDKCALNALSLVHNAAKREIADLVSVVLPTLQAVPHSQFASELHPDLIALKPWWHALLRFLFFVADTDDDLTRICTTPAVDISTRCGQPKIATRLQKNRKSLTDRYAFAMEYVFRAADRAMDQYCDAPCTDSLERLNVKIVSVVNFMLDSMHVAVDVVTQVYDVCNVSLAGLQGKVVDSLYSFAKDRKNIFVYMCVRWIHDDDIIKQWVHKYAGLKARLFFDSWIVAHDQQRASFIRSLAHKYIPS